jgi:hypothetical protein
VRSMTKDNGSCTHDIGAKMQERAAFLRVLNTGRE